MTAHVSISIPPSVPPGIALAMQANAQNSSDSRISKFAPTIIKGTALAMAFFMTAGVAKIVAGRDGTIEIGVALILKYLLVGALLNGRQKFTDLRSL